MRVPGRAGSALNRHGLSGAIEELLWPHAVPARAMITQTGPHLRDSVDLPRLRLCMVIALAPCVLICARYHARWRGRQAPRIANMPPAFGKRRFQDPSPGWQEAGAQCIMVRPAASCRARFCVAHHGD